MLSAPLLQLSLSVTASHFSVSPLCFFFSKISPGLQPQKPSSNGKASPSLKKSPTAAPDPPPAAGLPPKYLLTNSEKHHLPETPLSQQRTSSAYPPPDGDTCQASAARMTPKMGVYTSSAVFSSNAIDIILSQFLGHSIAKEPPTAPINHDSSSSKWMVGSVNDILAEATVPLGPSRWVNVTRSLACDSSRTFSKVKFETTAHASKQFVIGCSGVAERATGTTLNDKQKSEIEGQKLKDLKVKNYFFQAIDRPILETILSKETSKDIWDSMKKKYQGSARVKCAQLQALKRDFETLQMKDGESVTSYCARTMDISNKIGRGRGDRGNRDGIRHFKANDDQFQGKVRGQDQHFDKSKVECFRCHKFGHYRFEYYTKLPNDKEKVEKLNFAVEKNESETLLMAYHVNEELQ
ncbi:hypothetical protein CK203_022322 [Vitis vinifera]|uniref:Retrovirus-related Pol polyprotein from transposon TNT 1-94 n=1 Tax=Vitis vinifera TaxID=29760 RepID=A0A438I9A2_VITVI|nr:hypothetical protein CK203_022322 [Vitis vinifera]